MITTPWVIFDDWIPPVENHYFVMTDTHGRYDELKEFIDVKPENSIFLHLGDIGDRGNKTCDCFNLLSTIQNRILLFGNHDLMAKYSLLGNRNAFKMWCYNGGEDFIQSYSNYDKDDYNIHLENLIDDATKTLLNEMKLYHRDGNILFIHAGINPKISLHDNLNRNEIDAVHYREEFVDITKLHPVWIRYEFLCYNANIYDDYGNRLMIIHGHTPSPENPRITNNNINLDMGSTKMCALEILENKYRYYFKQQQLTTCEENEK